MRLTFRFENFVLQHHKLERHKTFCFYIPVFQLTCRKLSVLTTSIRKLYFQEHLYWRYKNFVLQHHKLHTHKYITLCIKNLTC